jgi:hypothetical protein
VPESHRRSKSDIQRLLEAWRRRRVAATGTGRPTLRSRVRAWLRRRRQAGRRPSRLSSGAAIRERLSDPRREYASERLLGSLRAVGMEQLSMQAATAGSLDTLVGGTLAGAGALAAVDIALKAKHAPLGLAALAAVFAIGAAVPRRPGNGPTITQILRMCRFKDSGGQEAGLEDDEVEWLLVGDIEREVHKNTRTLKLRSRMMALAIVSLLAGLMVLAVEESSVASKQAHPPVIDYNQKQHVPPKRRKDRRARRIPHKACATHGSGTRGAAQERWQDLDLRRVAGAWSHHACSHAQALSSRPARHGPAGPSRRSVTGACSQP